MTTPVSNNLDPLQPIPAVSPTVNASVEPVNPFDDPVTPDAGAGGVLDDVTGQTDVPSTAVDPADLPTYQASDLPDYGATTEDLTEDQLVSGNLKTILDEGGVLMDVARSAGAEYSNQRGALNSSMGAQASQRAMIDSALPIAQQDAASQLSQLQTNQMYSNRADEFNTLNAVNQLREADLVDANAAVQQFRDSILQSYQLQMDNISTDNRASLIDLEQEYARLIQSDLNATNVYQSSMDQIGELMNNGDLSAWQQEAGMEQLIGMLDAYLDFNTSINGINSFNPGADDGTSTPGDVLTDTLADAASTFDDGSQNPWNYPAIPNVNTLDNLSDVDWTANMAGNEDIASLGGSVMGPSVSMPTYQTADGSSFGVYNFGQGNMTFDSTGALVPLTPEQETVYASGQQ